MGVQFRGTSNFELPRRFHLGQTEISLDAPEEVGLRSDFINVLLDDEYGLGKAVGTPRTICDIGANIGLFSLWARHKFPDAKIHSYEPNPRVLECLQKNLQGQDVTVYPEAVGAESGKIEMEDKWDSRNAKIQSSSEGRIEMVSIATAIERLGGEIDLLKMDCEGGEWDIFQAADALKKVKVIRMEYHLKAHKKSVEDFKGLVTAAGYHIERMWEQEFFGIAWLKRR